jgi:hemerythrin-like domain-containing protein
MATSTEWLTQHIRRDHEWLLDRLRSLDNCLDNILYQGEVSSDLRGFSGLRLRCRELKETLEQHIPEEEEMFSQLEKRNQGGGLLRQLEAEHCRFRQQLEECLGTLETLESGELLPENLFHLQDRVQKLSAALQHHIATENQNILPLLQRR